MLKLGDIIELKLADDWEARVISLTTPELVECINKLLGEHKAQKAIISLLEQLVAPPDSSPGNQYDLA